MTEVNKGFCFELFFNILEGYKSVLYMKMIIVRIT